MINKLGIPNMFMLGAYMKQNPIPYYTLKQASNILNKKFDTDVYNSKTIISMALAYELNLHVLFSGDWIVNPFLYIPHDLPEEIDGGLLLKITETLSEFISKTLLYRCALLGLSERMIYELNIDGCTYGRNHYFTEFMEIENIFKGEDFNYIGWCLYEYGNRWGLGYNNPIFKNIGVEAIYLRYSEQTDVDKFYPKTIKIENPNDRGFSENYPLIKRKDVLITHIQLEKIINECLIHRVTHEKLMDESKRYIEERPNRGVSQAKLDAKLAAKTLAQYLWGQDRERIIKILEMAKIVHTELQKTEHQAQLPSIESVKEWLKPIAPMYARTAGRPQENND